MKRSTFLRIRYVLTAVPSLCIHVFGGAFMGCVDWYLLMRSALKHPLAFEESHRDREMEDIIPMIRMGNPRP